MLNASVGPMATDLRAYGEDDTADWVVQCSEIELVRVCSVAEWILYNGPKTAAGGSMMVAKACALACVYVREGVPRKLARSRRKSLEPVGAGEAHSRRPDYKLQAEQVPDYGVGDDLRRFWSE